jgi:cell wall-associated NlpC family hydrolase
MSSFRTYRIILLAILICLVSSDTAYTGNVKKHRARRSRRHAAVTIDTTAVRQDIIDTCDFDPLTDAQRTMIQEMNHWAEVRYHHGGLTKLGVDCSGFTTRIYQDALGISLPRTSREQAHFGEPVTKESLSFGDLLFFFSRSKKRITHVAIYLGDGRFIHSARKRGVGVSSLDESYFRKHFLTARRVVDPALSISSLNPD